MGEVSRPILRWHGGKWILAPWVIQRLPPHRIYVEPYGGAASVLLRKPRSYAEIYNDMDDEVVNLFRVARDRGEELAEALYLTPFSQAEFTESYEAATCAVERARRLVIRSFMGFGSNGCHRRSGFRRNSNRSGTTPAMDWMHYPEALRQTIDRLRGVVIERRDALDVMADHDGPHTVHYVDPPYVPETRDKGQDYAHEMTDIDHVALLGRLKELKGMVALSGYRCEMYDDSLAGWLRVDRAALADGARPRVESLWLNPAAQRAQSQQSLFGAEVVA